MLKKVLAVFLLLGVVSAMVVAPVAGQDKPNLSIVWFAWPPCDLLTNLVKQYPDANVTVSCVPIAQWHDQIFADFAAQGGADLPILDSQFMGEAVKGGHVVDITDFLKTQTAFSDFNPTALSYYAEVPLGSGHYYSAPFMTDTRMLVYRKDLFDNPDVQTAYKNATGKDLEVPKTWTELLGIAQFFKGSTWIDNGYATHWGNSGDQVQTTWNHILWSWGGELWDPATYKIAGVLNNDVGVQALQFAQQLFKTAPDGAAGFGFDETVGAICNGSTAMVEIWYGFGTAFTDPTTCAQSPNLGYGVDPGEKDHFISLGGMGISVSTYSKNQDASLALLKWLMSDDFQTQWVKGGGFSGRTSILASDAFLNAAPYNPSFNEAFKYVKDFWNIPEYNQLLSIEGEYLNLAISGQMDAKEALDNIATEQQAVLDKAYPNGAPAMSATPEATPGS